MSQPSQSVPNQEKNSEITENVDWKVKRNEALAKARDKASALRKQIRDATPIDDTPKAKTKLTDKLKKIKSLPSNDKEIVAVNAELHEVSNTVDIVNSSENVTAESPVDASDKNASAITEKLIETPVEKTVKPKKPRKTTVKKETIVVEEVEEPEEPEEVEEPEKIIKVEKETPVIDTKPTFQRGMNNVWYL
jgi:hypothetical protein